MSRFSTLAAAIAVILAQGCAHVGNPYSTTRRTDALYAQIQVGMTRDQVRALTGPPDNTMPFPASRTDSWGFYYWDTFGYYCEQSVTFGPDGLVISKLSRRLSDGGDGRS